MRRTLWKLLTAAAFACAFAAPSFAADPSPGIYALKGDNGKYLARCAKCVPGASYPDNAGVHEASSANGWSRWSLTKLANGKWALKSVDSGKYLARCDGCGPGSYPNSAFVHTADTSGPWSQWTLVQHPKGKWLLKADNGLYLARCNGCFKGGVVADTAFVHATNPDAAYAQWTLEAISVPKPAAATNTTGTTSTNCATVVVENDGSNQTLITDQSAPGQVIVENDGSAPLITDQDTCK